VYNKISPQLGTIRNGEKSAPNLALKIKRLKIGGVVENKNNVRILEGFKSCNRSMACLDFISAKV
jgi:hypothetical protein